MILVYCSTHNTAKHSSSLQIILTIIRLKQFSSEVLITLNTPIFVSGSSVAARDIGAGERADHMTAPSLFRRMLETFKIVDYSLFR